MNADRYSQPGSIEGGKMCIDPYGRRDQTFPTLAAEVVDRVRQYGHEDSFDGGTYLYRWGDRSVDLFLILLGAVDVLESDGHGGNIVVTTHHSNQFTGELNLLDERAAVSVLVLRNRPGSFGSRGQGSGEW